MELVVNSSYRQWFKKLNDASFYYRNHDLSALICYTGTRFWYKYGKEYRENLPAIILSRGTKIWYKEEKRHREGNLPAFICCNGEQRWYKQGNPIRKIE